LDFKLKTTTKTIEFFSKKWP